MVLGENSVNFELAVSGTYLFELLLTINNISKSFPKPQTEFGHFTLKMCFKNIREKVPQ